MSAAEDHRPVQEQAPAADRDVVLDILRDALQQQSDAAKALSTSVEEGFTGLRSEFHSAIRLIALALIVSQVLMFGLVGGSAYMQYGGAEFRVNAPEHVAAPVEVAPAPVLEVAPAPVVEVAP